MGNVTLEARTLESGKHSGMYGGAAPDALLARAARDRVAPRRARRCRGRGPAGATSGTARRSPRRTSASSATVLDGVPLIGTGGLGSRVWSGPAITVIGIDVAVRRRRGQRRLAVRARGAQRARASRAGRRRGPARRDRPPARGQAVRDRDRRAARARPATASRPRPTDPPTRRRAPRGRPPGAPTCCWPAAAARSRSSARSPARCRMPRRCWSAPPTATPTSTGRTSACC